MNQKSKDLRAMFGTLTVRNIPPDVDMAITEQAKAAGKSKSDFIQGFLTATFGDLIGNYIRSSQLVRLMDSEMSRMMEAEIVENLYDAGMTLEGHRQFERILGILDSSDVHEIMKAGVPYLGIRAKQLKGIKSLGPGASLYAALLVEAAKRDYECLYDMHQTLFFMQDEEQFLNMINEFRKELRLPLIQSPIF